MVANVNNNKNMELFGAAKSAVQSKAPSFQANPHVIKAGKLDSFIKAIPDKISSSEQRLIMGVTALFSQPFIDLNNKRVNEETRLMSFSRTLAKIVIGTTVGVLVRKGSIALAKHYTQMVPIPKAGNPKSCWGVPARSHSFLSPDYVRTLNDTHHQNYVNTLGTVLGVGVSLFTNFLIDAPLTQIMTNAVYSRIKKNNSDNLASVNLLDRFVQDTKVDDLKDGKNQSALLSSNNGKTESAKAQLSNDETKQDDSVGKPKTVSFGGDIKSISVPVLGKYIPKEGVEPIFHDHRRLKRWIWTSVATDPGAMLMHTGALGWAASSVAQITGMLFNDKIDTNKKKFLIPQEAADAAGNIGLYYGVTIALKKLVENAFEKGTIRIQSVLDMFNIERRKNGTPSGLTEELVFNVKKLDNKGLGVMKKLQKLPETKALYTQYKNGASILATIVASVISCNILTPYFRNYCASKWQEKLVKQNSKINAMVFDVERKNPDVAEMSASKSKAFSSFIV